MTPASATFSGGSSAGRGRSASSTGVERPLLRALPAERVRRDRDRERPRRRQGAGHGPPEPLLGSRRARRAARSGGGRRARDRHQPPRPAGRPPRAPARPLPDQRPARSLPRAAGAQARRACSGRCRWRRSATAAPGRPASIELWRALAERYGASEAARQMVDVLMLCPRARARPRRAGRPRRARGRRDRRARGRGPGPTHRRPPASRRR